VRGGPSWGGLGSLPVFGCTPSVVDSTFLRQGRPTCVWGWCGAGMGLFWVGVGLPPSHLRCPPLAGTLLLCPYPHTDKKKTPQCVGGQSAPSSQPGWGCRCCRPQSTQGSHTQSRTSLRRTLMINRRPGGPGRATAVGNGTFVASGPFFAVRRRRLGVQPNFPQDSCNRRSQLKVLPATAAQLLCPLGEGNVLGKK